MKILIYLMLLMSTTLLHALEVDEKLTLRFLKVSNTKKTVLVNRGAEDGLVAGNHAKFFTTAGVVARGVVEKVSPSRSIWSLYRIVDLNEITDGKVLNLKIGTPVKISEDSTKSLNNEVIPTGTDKISVQSSPKASEVDSFDTDSEELSSLQDTKKVPALPATNKTIPIVESSFTLEKEWEVWGNASANMLSGTATNINIGTVAASSPATTSAVDFSIGIEKYFFNSSSFLKQISLTGFVHSRNSKLGQDIQVEESLMEFGAGLRYHFTNGAAANTLIPFALLDAGIGSVTLQNKVISATTTSDPSIKGTNHFFAGGAGAKYILSNGLGFKTIIDYYSSSESYAYTESTGTRALSGLRLQAGVSYRF